MNRYCQAADLIKEPDTQLLSGSFNNADNDYLLLFSECYGCKFEKKQNICSKNATGCCMV